MTVYCVVVDTDNGQILNHNYGITEEVATNGPGALGLSPNLKVLIKYTPFAPPEYDSRFYTLTTVTEVTTEAHPTYPNFDVYKTTYSAVKRDVAYIKTQAKSARNVAYSEALPYEDQIDTFVKMLAILAKDSKGVPLSADEIVTRETFLAKFARILNNDENYNTLITAIDAGEEPDLDAGWDLGQ